MVAAIDVENLPGDQPGGVVGEERASGADVVDVHERAGRGLDLGLFQQRVELRNAGRGAGGERARRDGVDADALWPQLGTAS